MMHSACLTLILKLPHCDCHCYWLHARALKRPSASVTRVQLSAGSSSAAMTRVAQQRWERLARALSLSLTTRTRTNTHRHEHERQSGIERGRATVRERTVWERQIVLAIILAISAGCLDLKAIYSFCFCFWEQFNLALFFKIFKINKRGRVYLFYANVSYRQNEAWLTLQSVCMCVYSSSICKCWIQDKNFWFLYI